MTDSPETRTLSELQRQGAEQYCVDEGCQHDRDGNGHCVERYNGDVYQFCPPCLVELLLHALDAKDRQLKELKSKNNALAMDRAELQVDLGEQSQLIRQYVAAGDEAHAALAQCRQQITEQAQALSGYRRKDAEHPTFMYGRDAKFWNESYNLVRDALIEHLDEYLRDDDVSEESILMDGIAAAARALKEQAQALAQLRTALQAAEYFMTPEISRGPAIPRWQEAVDMVLAALKAQE